MILFHLPKNGPPPRSLLDLFLIAYFYFHPSALPFLCFHLACKASSFSGEQLLLHLLTHRFALQRFIDLFYCVADLFAIDIPEVGLPFFG